MNDINVKAMEKLVSDRIQEVISESNYVLNAVTKLNFKEAIKHQLGSIPGIYNFNVGEVKTLWETWSFKEKVIWFVRNKITGEAARVRSFVKDTVEKHMVLGTDNEFMVLDIRLPGWAEPEPKSIVVCSPTIQPNLPVQYIKMSFTI